MKTISLPLLVSTRVMQNLVGRAKVDLQESSIEATTGRAYNIADHMQGDTGAVHKMERLILTADRRSTSITLLQQEATNVQTVLSSIRDVAVDLGAEVESAVGLEDEQRLNALQDEARAQLDAIWGRLNTNFNGKYQFSGAETGTQPLGDLQTFLTEITTEVTGAANAGALDTALDAYFNDTAAGTFHTATYQGSTVSGPDREVSDSRRLGVDVKATDAGLRNALRGLALLATADSAATPELARELKRDAAETLSIASVQIIDQQSIIGALEEDAEILQTQTETEKATYELLLLETIGIDQYEAASRMTILETQLEATYLATSRIANLSLTNFL